MKYFRIIIGVLFLAICFSILMKGVDVSFADNLLQPTPISDDEVNAIAKQIICPVCNNVTLDVCDTQACAQWKELIRQKLAEGWNADDIKTYLVDLYGDSILTEPHIKSSFFMNLVVYVAPLIITIIILSIGVLYIKHLLKKNA